MADWYVSSVKWAALPQWHASTAYAVGHIVRQLTGTSPDNECAYMCTTAGTSASSEPGWQGANNATTGDGSSLVWTNVTGQAAQGWAAPAGSVSTLTSGVAVTNRFGFSGARIFVDSAHGETGVSSNVFSGWGYAYQQSPVLIYSVNSAGAVPPGAADYLPGAAITTGDGTATANCSGALSVFGFTIHCNIVVWQENQYGPLTFKDCLIVTAYTVSFNWSGNAQSKVVLINTKVQPASGARCIFNMDGSTVIEWLDTPDCLNGAAAPLYLVSINSWNPVFKFRGLDLTGFSGSTLAHSGYQSAWYSFEGCVLPASLTINDAFPGAGANVGPLMDFVNCDSANTNYNNFRASNFGTLLTDTGNYLSGGATDGVTPYSHALTSSLNVGGQDADAVLNAFPVAAYNSTTGTLRTATVQVISSGTLTAADLVLDLDYLGSTSTCVSETVSTGAALNTAALPAGSGAWTSPPATPVQQKLQVSFTPQKAGLVTARVKLTKPSATVWIDPRLVIA